MPQIGGRTFVGKNGKHYMQIQAFIPPETPLSTTGSDYIFSIDTSGSMDTEAWVKVEGGAGEMGVTRLDLVKHLLKTILGMLGPEDRVALIAFSSTARRVADLTPVTDAGRAFLSLELDKLYANECTHLYGGVEEAARVASSEACRGRRIVGMILTDGVPTESIPPVTGGRSTLAMIQERIRVANPWIFHAIGFSSDINSRLLEQVAALWKGRLLFVPSGDMVSTNGINLAAFEKTVVSLGTEVHLGPETQSSGPLAFGPLAIGQRRSCLWEASPASRITFAQDYPPLPSMDSVELSDCQNDFVETLTQLIDKATLAYDTVPDLESLLVRPLLAFYERHAGATDPKVHAIRRDVVSKMEGEGQCRLALKHLRPNDWGLHYLRAYRDHMRDGVCMNFKDPGLKIYESAPFLEFQRQGDEVFASIRPPPIRRRGAVSASINISSAFNNSSGSCFEGSMQVRMGDGLRKPIRTIRRGDRVMTPEGPVTVEYAIEFTTQAPSQPMVQLAQGIAVTPWHPCRLEGGAWTFPAELAPFAARPLRTVYNLVLDRGHVIESGPYQFVTLGHGFQEAPLRHAFFGSKERIVASLEKQPGFEEGRPVYRNLVAVKEGGMIVDWTDV
jgi:hypothetical protein